MEGNLCESEEKGGDMTTTGFSVLDTTVQKTQTWLKDIMYELGSEDRHRAYLALRGTLHALRDRLTPEEAADLGAQFPMLIRGLYYEGWHPSGKPEKIRDKEEFLSRVEKVFPNEPKPKAEDVVRAVFKVMFFRVDEGEIQDVKNMLPPELADLWPRRI
jgi:uncharacterized protein (DUF2267 family)